MGLNAKKDMQKKNLKSNQIKNYCFVANPSVNQNSSNEARRMRIDKAKYTLEKASQMVEDS